MKNMFKLLPILAALIFLNTISYATHLAGGKISYECVNDSTYIIMMDLYGDCSGNQVLFGSAKLIGIKNPCGTDFIYSLPLINIGGTEISPLCADSISASTCNGGNLPGIIEYRYSDTIVIGNPCSNITIAFQEANRNFGSLNIFNSGSNRFHIETNLNTLTAPCNNSPVSHIDPIHYSCVNQQVSFNYGMTDYEGDSLVYSFVQVNGFSSGNILTGSPTNLTYTVGHSLTSPIPGISLNASSGELIFTGTVAGHYIVDLAVDQYAGGVLIGTVEFDMNFVVTVCSNDTPIPPISLSNFVPSTNPPAVQSGNLEITADWLQSFCVDVEFSDSNNVDSMTLDTAALALVLPGATATFNHGNPATVIICWTPPSGFAGGTYYITIEARDDACPIFGRNTITFSIIVPPKATVAIPNFSHVSCNGGADGSATATGSFGTPPYTFNWSNGVTNNSITGLSAGTYTVTLTDDDGTTDTDSIVITEPLPLAIAVSSTPTSCNGGSDGTAIAIGNGGTPPYVFDWSNGVNNTDSIVGLVAGTYFVTITDTNGCVGIDSVVVTEPQPIIITTNTTPVSCNGGSNGIAHTTATGGTVPYIFNWSNGVNNDSIVGLVAGTYTVTLTDSNGCIGIDSITITEPAPIAATITPLGSTLICSGSNVDLQANGGIGFSYQWQLNGMDISGANSQVYSASQAGGYQVKIMQNSCQSISSVIFITVSYPTASFTGLNSSYCANDQVDSLIGSPAGGTFSGPGTTGNLFDPQLAGTGVHYIIYSYTDTNNCTAVDSQQVEISANPTISGITGPQNVQPSISYFYSVVNNIGSTYSWSVTNGTIINSNNDTVEIQWNNVSSGTLYATETNQEGCEDSTLQVINIMTTSIENKTSNLSVIEVYPNPVSGQLFVETQQLGDTTLSIEFRDLQGQILMSQQLSKITRSRTHIFDVSQLASGVYLLLIRSESGFFTQRILVDHNL